MRVHYSGEAGIDTCAMFQEFLSKAIADMGREMFPDGSPTDSTYHVQNGNYRTCGEIVAVSLSQGGPPPCFLEQYVYESLFKSPNMVNIKEADLTTKEQNLVNDMRNNYKRYTYTILEHSYNGKVDEKHVDDIVRSLKVSLVNRRLLYMKEFLTGLSLYGLADLVTSNPSAFQLLFVNGSFKQQLTSHANYLLSLMKPQYSLPGSSRRQVEENVMDHFQECLNLFEDSELVGYFAASGMES